MTILKSIHSELIKLKYPPILWMVGFILLINLGIVFIAHYLDIHNRVQLGTNPWIKIDRDGQAIFSMFIGIPFIVLFISALVHIEYQNKGFKQLYTLPKNREILILYKLATFLLSLLLILFLLLLGIILIGYLLNIIYPETEFTYFELPLFSMIKSYAYLILPLLGIIGIQFFLSLRFQGFLVPASLGVLAYVIGTILSSINNSMSLYFPYCYPMIAKELGIFNHSELQLDPLAILNKVELGSIGVFVVFILLSLVLERRRNI